MVLSTLQKAIYDFFAAFFVAKSLTYNIQWDNENSNKRPLPLCELYLLNMIPIGSTIQGNPNSTGLAQLYKEFNPVVRVVLSGIPKTHDPLAHLMALTMVDKIDSLVEPMRASVGLSILHMTDPLPLPVVTDIETESRATSNITFSMLDKYNTNGVDVGLIEHVEIEGQFVRENGQIRIIPIFANKPEP